MKLRDLIKKKCFWAALSGALIIILQLCGVKVDAPLVNEIVLGVCSLLIAAGVITASDTSGSKDNQCGAGTTNADGIDAADNSADDSKADKTDNTADKPNNTAEKTNTVAKSSQGSNGSDCCCCVACNDTKNSKDDNINAVNNSANSIAVGIADNTKDNVNDENSANK